MKKILYTALISIGISKLLSAQNLNFFGVTPTISQTGRIVNMLNYNLFASTSIDLFNTTIDGVSYPSKVLQLYIQPSLIYAYSPNLNFTGSLTYNYQRSNSNASFFKEWRTWEQVLFGHGLSHGRMTHRVRYEQRFIENENTETWPMTTRIRYQLGFNIPLQGKTLDVGELYFNYYNEAYFTLTVPPGTLRNALYSEYWIYSGLGYQTKKTGRIEVGPLLQFNVRDAQQDLRNLYLLQVSWITNLNFPTKKVAK